MIPPAPEPAADLALAVRLREGDKSAASDLIRAYVDHLGGWLVAKYPHTDPHFCQEAAHDALLELLRTPDRFDPSRGELGTYLRRAAQCDLLNRLRREGKHHRRRDPLDSVELPAPAGNEPVTVEEFPELAAVIRNFTPEERQVWELMFAGERDTAVFAQTLGWGEMPDEERRQQVYALKDRVKQKLRRAWRAGYE
jgi:DNA-directed RNA polymerase specialized sigma24 family protein